MTQLIYDGTWDGLLSAIFIAFPRADVGIRPGVGGIEPTMFDTHAVQTNMVHAERLSKGMARLHREMPNFVYKGFLCEQPGYEDDLLHALRLGFHLQTDPFTQRQHPFVYRVCAAQNRAAGEAHRMLGLVRFVQAHDDLFLGDISPDCNILPLIGQHFHERFNKQRLILRDVRRMTAMVSTTRAWWIVELSEPLKPLPPDKRYGTMWHSYFRAIAQPERANPHLQQHYVPLKYRKFLTEFDY